MLTAKKKLNIILFVLFAFHLGAVAIYFYFNHQISLISLKNVDGKQQYFEKYLRKEMETELKNFIATKAKSQKEKIEKQRQIALARGKDRNLPQFFGDDTSGVIIIQSTRSSWGKSNQEIFGSAGVIAFNKLKAITMKYPGKYLTGSYFENNGENNERVGLYTYNEADQIIYGLVLRDAFFSVIREKKLRSLNIRFLAFIILMFLVLLLTLHFIKKYKSESGEFKIALDKAESGIAILEKDSTMTWANNKFRTLFGESLIGKPMLSTSKFPRFPSVFEECLLSGKSNYQITEDLQGETKTFSVELTVYTPSTLSTKKILFQVTDVTQAIRSYEVFSHDLTRQLDNVYTSAHTLLRKLQMGSDLKDEEITQYLSQILYGIKGSRLYGESLLLWARYQTASIGQETGAFNVKEYMNQLHEELSFAFELLNIDVTFHLPQKIFFNTDTRSFQASIRNLLSNAMTAVQDSPRKKIQISIRETGTYLTIEILDTGAGMSKEMANAIFDTKSSFRGLGSYLISKYVEVSKGHIQVDYSHPDYGTSITMKLPTN